MDPVAVFRLSDVAVTHEPAPAGSVVDGAPTIGWAEVTTLGDGLEVGVWEMGVGAVRDVEADEVFLVLAGRGTIEVDGSAPVEIGVGDLVRLTAGTATVWHVTEPVRKLYLTAA